MESAQVRRTKKHIQTCLLELMEKYGMQNVTVVQLVKYAEINRGTFYKYYSDKYHVLEEIEESLFDEYYGLLQEKVDINLKTILLKQSESELQEFLCTQILTITTFFYDNRKLVKNLLGKHGDPQFVKKLEDGYVEFIQKKLTEVMAIDYDAHYYGILFFLKGVIAIVEEWILIEGKESPEEMAELMATTFFVSPLKMIGLK